MQLIGARVIVLCPSASYGLQWKSGYLRAASEPVLELVHLLRPDMQVRGGGRKGKGGGSRGACVGDIQHTHRVVPSLRKWKLGPCSANLTSGMCVRACVYTYAHT